MAASAVMHGCDGGSACRTSVGAIGSGTQRARRRQSGTKGTALHRWNATGSVAHRSGAQLRQAQRRPSGYVADCFMFSSLPELSAAGG